MKLATPCGLCGEPIEDKCFRDNVTEGPICSDCALSLEVARVNLNKAGMVGIFYGSCPDNDAPKSGKGEA